MPPSCSSEQEEYCTMFDMTSVLTYGDDDHRRNGEQAIIFECGFGSF